MDKIVIDKVVSKKADEFAEREYASGADEREWLSKGYYWGYKDAEKELSLTWEDIRKIEHAEKVMGAKKESTLTWEDIKMIVNIADYMIDLDIQDELPECCDTEQGYYEEILKRYYGRKK